MYDLDGYIDHTSEAGEAREGHYRACVRLPGSGNTTGDGHVASM